MTRTVKLPYLIVLIVVALSSVLFFGCKGDTGPAGPAGTNPQMAPVVTAVVAFPDSLGTGETTTLLAQAYDPNGDSMTYTWSATSGTLHDASGASIRWTAPDSMGLQNVTVVVADSRGATATGLVVVGVNTYVPAVYPYYLGDDANRCGHCHGDLVAKWQTSAHSRAWEDLVNAGSQNNLYCVQCHTTGFNTVYDHSGNLTTPGTNNGGYDYNPTPAMYAVQCEQCHSPMGPVIGDHTPQIAAALTGQACARCHEQNEEYATSGHGTVLSRMTQQEMITEWGGTSCRGCHISEGFLIAKDPDWANTPFPTETAYQVTCVTCHDQHGNGIDKQLRTVADVTTPYGGPDQPTGATIHGWGAGQLCAQCHHARRTESQILAQIASGNAHPGPHESAQADMLLGRGSYEISGMTYNRTSQHQPSMPGMENMCIACHMTTIPRGEPGGPYNGHSFAPDTRGCTASGCHTAAPNFDLGGKQTEIRAELETLKNLLPLDSAGNVMAAMDTTHWTLAQREAGYAYLFVESDKSMGVHNYPYTKSLLDNAITHLTSGVMQSKRQFANR